jgi:hypothetical protein
MIDMALGRAPMLLDTALDGAAGHTGPAGTRPTATALVYPDQTGMFTGMIGIDELSSCPGAPEWYPTMAIGTRVESLGDQRASTGLLLVEGATTELAVYNALSASARLRPTMGAGS